MNVQVSSAFSIFVLLLAASDAAIDYDTLPHLPVIPHIPVIPIDRAKPARGPNFSLYNFHINDVKGDLVDFKASFMGKVILVVNVASECGFTDGHYKGLQELHQLLAISERFSVVAFPCNQFGGQEPKTNIEIHEFATKNYQTTFPILEKVDVMGETAHDFWKLIEATTGQPPNWNFWKYLVDYQGNVINFWGPWSTVEEITPFVKDAVDQAVKELARKRQSTESAGMPSTENQVQPESMSRAPPLPLHRARPPPPPKIPSARLSIEAPPPPLKDGSKKAPLPPPGPPQPPSSKPANKPPSKPPSKPPNKPPSKPTSKPSSKPAKPASSKGEDENNKMEL